MHVGGVQDAITVPAPAEPELAVPTLPYTVLVAPEAPTETGFEVLHVSGTPATGWSAMSVTVAFSVVAVLLFTTNEVVEDGSPAAAMEILFTRQVSIEIGWPRSPLADA